MLLLQSLVGVEILRVGVRVKKEVLKKLFNEPGQWAEIFNSLVFQGRFFFMATLATFPFRTFNQENHVFACLAIFVDRQSSSILLGPDHLKGQGELGRSLDEPRTGNVLKKTKTWHADCGNVAIDLAQEDEKSIDSASFVETFARVMPLMASIMTISLNNVGLETTWKLFIPETPRSDSLWSCSGT